jgi:hypothetical protein
MVNLFRKLPINLFLSAGFTLFFPLIFPASISNAQENTFISDPKSAFLFRYEMLAPPPGPPGDIAASDMPNDPGKSVLVTWTNAPGDNGVFHAVDAYLIYRADNPDSGFIVLSRIPGGSNSYSDSDTSLANGHEYYYKVASLYGTDTLFTAVSNAATPSAQLFHTQRIVVLALMLAFSGFALYFIFHARRGKAMYVRPIAGINAVDEAIGRATEMGRPILFVPGLGDPSQVATIAAFTVLGRVAHRVAEYQTRIIVPNYDPVVMAICQEVVKEAYTAEGRAEAYNERDVYFVTQDQFPYTASVNGTMLRERPATNFYMGKFYAESLVLSETGFVAGSIQIAGTDELVQIPFFVAACDYTLMGEELYAASAYLSQEPQQLGTIKAQDIGKVIAIALMIIGAAVYLFSSHAGDMLSAFVQGG